MQLWWEYVTTGDPNALDTLLAYNREDVLNLHVLRHRLALQEDQGSRPLKAV